MVTLAAQPAKTDHCEIDTFYDPFHEFSNIKQRWSQGTRFLESPQKKYYYINGCMHSDQRLYKCQMLLSPTRSGVTVVVILMHSSYRSRILTRSSELKIAIWRTTANTSTVAVKFCSFFLYSKRPEPGPTYDWLNKYILYTIKQIITPTLPVAQHHLFAVRCTVLFLNTVWYCFALLWGIEVIKPNTCKQMYM